jgi:hypothetical protein
MRACLRQGRTPAAALLLSALLATCRVASQEQPRALRHDGMCDASAAVSAGRGLFIVADDEDNILRLYRSGAPGGPLSSIDLSAFLGADAAHPEADIEGAARIGNRAYWITSHGTNRDGKARPGRRRLFATDITARGGGVAIAPAGAAYKDLLRDLIAAPQLRGVELDRAAGRPPKGQGGLNIEGLAATPAGTLLIGFRNPLVDGKALVVPLENPDEVVMRGAPAALGAPVLLDLGGLGVRSIEYVPACSGYLIIGGPAGGSGACALFRWSGAAADRPVPVASSAVRSITPEAVVALEGEDRVLILSDDGTTDVSGVPCKNADPKKRHFRSVVTAPCGGR